ncbi:MAG: inositol phosphorylceramide synthase [Saprospiraceae bacterium]|nr:inositol phosphorylceramide synthase [Saprospiraceae bacterium]MBP7642313.1 inositol phosphorylceramide synthase [Saprospiraceae bacterium]
MSYCSSLEPQKPQLNSQLLGIIFLGLYLCFCYFFIGLRTDHLQFASFLLIMLIISKYTRTFTLSMVFYILYWIIYDAMRIYPNYLFNEISTSGIYELEKSIFGIFDNGQLVTLNEYFAIHNSTFLDVMVGIFYLCWVPVPLAISMYLYFWKKDIPKLLEFSFVFLFINLLGFVLYYLFPASPPWYIAQNGFEVDYAVIGNPGNLIKFDQFFNTPIFQNMYTKNANVFAAIPSLHAAYPVIATYYCVKYRFKFFAILSIIVTLGIAFSAVYSLHHYLIDVVLGILCAFAGIFIYEKFLSRTKVNTLLNKFAVYIANQNTKIED